METVTVKASKTYDILIDKKLLDQAGSIIKDKFGVKTICVITDSTVDNLYSDSLIKALNNAGHIVYKYVFTPGEESKTLKTYTDIINFLAEKRITRSDMILALGGGITGDITGCAAATYLRGIKLIQFPTTLLACVDSSVGGKTGVNLELGKNLVGAFYQPDMVICDYETLNTLSYDIFTDGVAEVIKYGVISDSNLFEILESNSLYNNKAYIEDIISKCITIKRDIINVDEHDTGVRQLLNFGHTLGHAIEKLSEYKIAHGKSVAIGMVIASRAAFKLHLSDYDCTERIITALNKNNLPTECPFTADQIFNIALSDKKRSGNNVNVIVPKYIGHCCIHTLKINELKDFIEKGLS